MIKMVNCKYKLTVVHFARPDPMQICACAWIYHRASGLRGLRAVAGREPLGHCTALNADASNTIASLSNILPAGFIVYFLVVRLETVRDN